LIIQEILSLALFWKLVGYDLEWTYRLVSFRQGLLFCCPSDLLSFIKSWSFKDCNLEIV